MSDDLLSPAIAQMVAAANAHHGREPSPTFRDALNRVSAVTGLEAGEKVFRVAAALDRVTSPCGAGFIAIWLGASVEHGIDPAPQIRPLLDCLQRFLRQVEDEPDGDAEGSIDDDLAIGLEFLGQGLVAHLSRDQKSLRDLQQDAPLLAELERTQSCSPGPMWILELAHKASGNLIVLHGQHLVGVRVEYRNLSNCFHLFTLLQAALAGIMPGARKAVPEVIAVAQGEALGDGSDEAWWHYGQPVEGPPNIITSVFGEQNPKEILAIDGQQVLLVWPPILASRSWDGGFFGPALSGAPPAVDLMGSLSTQEVLTWRQRLGLATAPEGPSPAVSLRPWWKFW